MSANERRNGGKTGRRVRVGRAGMILGLLGGGLLLASAAWSQPGRPGTEPAKKMTVEEWRKQFPFVSLGDRLAYEAGRPRGQTAPALSEEAKKQLEAVEHIGPWGNMRVESLKLLHSQEAEKFVKRQGFGLERMPSPSTRYLNLPTAPTIPSETVSYPESFLDEDPPTKLPQKGQGIVGPARLPSEESLKTVHTVGRWSFLTPDSLGFVKDRNQIAGFEPHQFRYNPLPYALYPDTIGKPKAREGKERWALRRLELVSLSKFDKPAVYISDHLPRMQDLKNTPRRELSAFEAKGLKRLQAGEDVVTEATTNRIRMLGALRASKQCLQCHEGQRGELLGSFSYELLRDPPITVR